MPKFFGSQSDSTGLIALIGGLRVDPKTQVARDYDINLFEHASASRPNGPIAADADTPILLALSVDGVDFCIVTPLKRSAGQRQTEKPATNPLKKTNSAMITSVHRRGARTNSIRFRRA